MKQKKSWVAGLFFFLILMLCVDIQAQKFLKDYKLSWTEPEKYDIDGQSWVEALHFDEAVYLRADYLPVLYDAIPAALFYEEYDYTISNEEYLPLTQKEVSLLPKGFAQKELAVQISTSVEKKKNFMDIVIMPIVQKTDGNYYKLVSFRLSAEGKKGKPNSSKRTYATHSLLSSGAWYKVSVAQTGIYKVTYENLQTLGAIAAPIPSAYLSIFGYGSGPLPEKSGENRFDDLTELPIAVFDGGSGLFGAGSYFIFYAESPHSWKYNAVGNTFSHVQNIFADNAYYFINVDPGIGSKRRISSKDNSSLNATATASTYTHYDFKETDLTNFSESGQVWVGDEFSSVLQRSYSFSLPGYRAEAARISLRVANQSSVSNRMAVVVTNNQVGSLSLSASVSAPAALNSATYSFIPNENPLNVQLTFTPNTPSAKAYLDWIEIQAKCNLTMHSDQFAFCVPEHVGAGNVIQYNISNADGNTTVWDVTRIEETVAMTGLLSGGTFAFKAPADELHKYVAFNHRSFKTITTVGRVTNQNLHGESQVDMVIVVHPDFMSEAEKLAAFRRSNDRLSVKIVTPQQVYNEFASGAADPTAIKYYMKMIYEKSGGAYPQYLLLFGRPSYDYRGRVANAPKLFVPNYQIESSLGDINQRSCDDYFALLDDNEGTTGKLDVAVGRFPVTNADNAAIAVEKTLNYSSPINIISNENSTQVSNFGDWRNVLAFVCDDDSPDFIRSSDTLTKIVADSNAAAYTEKIYSDSYQRVSYSGGQRYPDANIAINNRMRRGALIMNYIGHGSGERWASETLFELADISRWDNKYNQPLMITLTCSFGGYDRAAISGAEQVFLSSKGGAAALITTSRVAFEGSNSNYGVQLYKILYQKINSRNVTIGELNRLAKNAAGGAYDVYNMIYTMGDPSMKLAIPHYKIVTDSINGFSVATYTDTLKALAKVTIKGHLEDLNHNRIPYFSGVVYPTVYDKKTRMHTLQNDPGYGYFEFDVQKNILFKGKSTVKNGQFEFTFITPKDINYQYGNGKISYYANSNADDASGSCSAFLVGGMSLNVAQDEKGPEIMLYMNDENFVNGGVTNQNPTLIVKLWDESGINTTGNGIGHDITATLDNAIAAPTTLNDYYQAVKDSFNCGVARYPYQNLEQGKHTMKVRAWDIYNNVSEKTLDFVVSDDKTLALDHVLNYPNPFTTRTAFYFEHNKPGQPIDVVINIYTISGIIVRTFKEVQVTEGNRSNPIYWDGRDNYGDKLGKGVYIYQLKIRDASGKTAEKIEKIVIL